MGIFTLQQEERDHFFLDECTPYIPIVLQTKSFRRRKDKDHEKDQTDYRMDSDRSDHVDELGGYYRKCFGTDSF